MSDSTVLHTQDFHLSSSDAFVGVFSFMLVVCVMFSAIAFVFLAINRRDDLLAPQFLRMAGVIMFSVAFALNSQAGSAELDAVAKRVTAKIGIDSIVLDRDDVSHANRMKSGSIIQIDAAHALVRKGDTFTLQTLTSTSALTKDS